MKSELKNQLSMEVLMEQFVLPEKVMELSPEENYKLKELFTHHKFALEEIKTKVNILNEEFILLKDYNPIEHIKTRMKKPESIRKKLLKKNLDMTYKNISDHIQDISGVRIICSFKNDIFTVAEMIKSQDDIEVVEVKDYVTYPKESGYQSYHMVVKVPIFLSNKIKKMCVEIQIRTSAMDFWASLEHKMNYKFKHEIPENLAIELKECAMAASKLDEKMYNIKQRVDLVEVEGTR